MPKYTYKTPSVYINDMPMAAFADSRTPVLSGLTVNFGSDNDQEMQPVETCSFELLIKEPTSLDFLQLGTPVAVVNEADEETYEDGQFTYFVGRIARASVRHASKAGMIIVSVQAVDLTADYANHTVFGISLGSQSAADRFGTIGLTYGIKDFPVWPPFGTRWPTQKTADIVHKSMPYLDVLDRALRAQLMVRRNASWYKPGTGIQKAMHLILDSRRSTSREFIYQSTGDWGPAGTWHPVAQGLPSGFFQLGFEGLDFLANNEWVKEPEDVITDVSLQRIDAWNGTDDSTRTPIGSRIYVDTEAMRAKYGQRTIEFDIDMQAGAPVDDNVKAIFNHWLNDKTPWRTKRLVFADTRTVRPRAFGYMVAPTSRYTCWLSITGLPDNRPEPGRSLMRGLVIGGTATWTTPEDGAEPRWELEINLGRNDLVITGGDYWDCQKLADYAPLADATCATVGDDLTFDDFTRLGAP